MPRGRGLKTTESEYDSFAFQRFVEGIAVALSLPIAVLQAGEPLVILTAAKLGKTRLIDNLEI